LEAPQDKDRDVVARGAAGDLERARSSAAATSAAPPPARAAAPTTLPTSSASRNARGAPAVVGAVGVEHDEVAGGERRALGDEKGVARQAEHAAGAADRAGRAAGRDDHRGRVPGRAQVERDLAVVGERELAGDRGEEAAVGALADDRDVQQPEDGGGLALGQRGGAHVQRASAVSAAASGPFSHTSPTATDQQPGAISNRS